jgi:exosortase/archaeosortase family protein
MLPVVRDRRVLGRSGGRGGKLRGGDQNNCNAIYEIGLYAAAVWAYPASIRDRLRGTVMGAVVLYGVNLLRIVTLIVLGLLAPAWFGPTHLYAWQLIFLLVVAACWLGWIARVRPGG